MTDPADLTLVDLLPLLERRELSARELLDACLAHVERSEAQVRAFVVLTPDLARAAAEAGQRGVVSTPFPPGASVTGGLNLYLQFPLTGSAAERERAERFSRHAVVPVANALLHGRAQQLVEHLQVALESRAVIDQAKGILVERFRLTAAQAFDALTRVSNQTNTKVRDLAVHLVQTGEFPPA